MKKLFALFPIVIACFSLTAQTSALTNLLWRSQTGHPTINEDYVSSVKNNAGDVYYIGNTYHLGEQENLLIRKYTALGRLIWQQELNSLTSARDFGADIYLKGNYLYVTGTSWDSVNEKSKLWVLKLAESTGNVIWSQNYQHDTTSFNIGTAIKVDDQQNVYVAGTEQISASDYGTVLIKYDSTGTQMWVSRYDSTGVYDAPVAMLLSSPNITVTGYRGNSFLNWGIVTANFNMTSGALNSVATSSNGNGGIDKPIDITNDYNGNLYVLGITMLNGVNSDWKLIKYDTLLNEVWVRILGSSDSLADEPTAMTLDNLGQLVITGWRDKLNGGRDGALIRLNLSGTILWGKTISAPTETKRCMLKDVAIGQDNHIYATGTIENGTDMDFITTSYDINGNLIWSKFYGDTADSQDDAGDIQVDPAGNVFVSGTRRTKVDTMYVTILYGQSNAFLPKNTDSVSRAACFFENRGQVLINDTLTADSVFYYSTNYNPQLFIGDNRISYVLGAIDTISEIDTLVRIDFVIEDSAATSFTADNIYPDIKRNEIANYYLGSVPIAVSNLQGYARIIQKRVCRNIDWTISANVNGLTNSFIVSPNGNVTDMVFKYNGIDSFSLVNKSLILYSTLGNMLFDTLSAYEVDGSGNRTGVTVSYTTLGANRFAFSVGSYDPDNYLIIEQRQASQASATSAYNLDWSTYYGGVLTELFYDNFVSASGDVYACGQSNSPNFPSTLGQSVSAPSNHTNCATLVKFNNDGERKFATYFGGSYGSRAYSIAVNSANEIFVCGPTEDSNFPVLPYGTAYQATGISGSVGNIVSYLARFNEINGGRTYASYFDGEQNSIYINKDHNGQENLYMVGTSATSSFPIQSSSLCGSGCFNFSSGSGCITKFDNNLHITWATRFGGSATGNSETVLKSITNGEDNNIIFVGNSGDITSSNFNLVHSGSEYTQAYGGGACDGILMRFDDSDNLIYSTFIGGDNIDELNSVSSYVTSADVGGRLIYIAGSTFSSNFPTIEPAPSISNCYREGPALNRDAVFMEFAFNNQMYFSTYYGGSGEDYFNNVDGTLGKAYVCGGTESSNAQIQTPSGYYLQSPKASSGSSDALLAKFNDYNLFWSTYLGGSWGDFACSIAPDNNGHVFVVGATNSQPDPVTPSNGFPLVQLSPACYFQNKLNQTTVQGTSPYVLLDAYISRFDVSSAVDIFDEKGNSNLQLSPNPTSDLVYIGNPGITTGMRFSILDIHGRLLYNTTYLPSAVSLLGWPAGLYIFKLEAENVNFVGKIIKE